MEKALEKKIKLKIAISLNLLLEERKKESNNVNKKDFLGNSYNTIALNADIRKATVSNIFNAISNPNSTTLISIIEAMGYSMTDFSKVYCSINEQDIYKFCER
jgi:DNA invertase Pin-like site-specific DNA recombinase